jgi:hypothetical protein
MQAKTLVTGVIGADTHIVGNRILSTALEKAGYKVVALGALTPAGDFIKAAIETAADAIMVSSLYGQGEIDCRGFRDLPPWQGGRDGRAPSLAMLLSWWPTSPDGNDSAGLPKHNRSVASSADGAG